MRMLRFPLRGSTGGVWLSFEPIAEFLARCAREAEGRTSVPISDPRQKKQERAKFDVSGALTRRGFTGEELAGFEPC